MCPQVLSSAAAAPGLRARLGMWQSRVFSGSAAARVAAGLAWDSQKTLLGRRVTAVYREQPSWLQHLLWQKFPKSAVCFCTKMFSSPAQALPNPAARVGWPGSILAARRLAPQEGEAVKTELKPRFPRGMFAGGV